MAFLIYSKGREVSGEVFASKLEGSEVNLFESLRTYGGKIFRKGEHLKRLQQSAKTCGWKKIPDQKKLSRELECNLKAFSEKKERARQKDLFLRLTLFRGEMFTLIGERKHRKALYRRGIALKTSPVIRTLSNAAFPEAKTGAYQNAVLASLQPKDDLIYEWVFLDREGFVTEVRIGNLFVVRDGELVTPRRVGILNGVTKRFVIECAEFAGMSVKQRPLMRHEVYNSAEAFLTNTSWEILPVRELDGRRIGKTTPGPVTTRLQKLFTQRAKAEINSQRKGDHESS